MKTRQVLVVEDEHALALALSSVVVRAGAEAVKVASGAAALEQLEEGGFSLVILDIGLPDMSGLEVLQRAFPGDAPLPIPVLVITAHGNLENAIAARKLGASDYLVKPLDLPAFQDVLGRHLKPVKKPDAMPGVVETETTLIGGAAAMQPVFREVAHACSVSMPVVISGNTGTGKSLASRVIHTNGTQQEGALVTFEADALSSDGRGTLLVEDVDGLDSTDQEHLLKQIEADADLRVIATTRDSLHAAVAAGRFRDDLYYRINALEIRMPDLADRIEDVPALAQYFLGRSASDRVVVLSPEVMAILEKHSWPGNVLELRNAIEYAVGVCGGAQILPQHLPASVVVKRAEDTGELVASLRVWLDEAFSEGGEKLRYADLIGGLEGELLKELLRRFDDKPTRLAAALRMNRTTLRKKCAELLGDGD